MVVCRLKRLGSSVDALMLVTTVIRGIGFFKLTLLHLSSEEHLMQ